MANVCLARLMVEPLPHQAGSPFLIAELTERLRTVHYDYFEVLTDDGDAYLEIECGFRWAPPFEKLLAVSADLHVSLRCTYHEDGCCFMGAWRAEDGVVTKDDYIEYA
jgi:hypothetical protein